MHIHTSAYLQIFLIGFMGSGKTYWGNKWANRAGLQFFDIDKIIEDEQTNIIAKIFEVDGEEHFRNLETEALKNLKHKTDIIVACGGGTPCFNDNINWMNNNGISVYLQSSANNILQRLLSEKETRPLIKNLQEEEMLFYITEKIKEREFFYRQATLTLQVDDLPPDYLPDFINL